jgi:hypothetical protein
VAVARKTYRETPDVAAATARLIVTVGKRVATEDPEDLRELLTLDQALSDAWLVAVAGLRETGFSDSEIGRVLGITKQAVAQRWPRPSTDRATSVACRQGAAL